MNRRSDSEGRGRAVTIEEKLRIGAMLKKREVPMPLVIGRRCREGIVITHAGEQLTIRVWIEGFRIKVGVDGPRSFEIRREELRNEATALHQEAVQEKVMHLLLRAHEVICDQQEALRMAAEVRGAAAELERLHARLAKTYGHLIKPKEPD